MGPSKPKCEPNLDQTISVNHNFKKARGPLLRALCKRPFKNQLPSSLGNTLNQKGSTYNIQVQYDPHHLIDEH